MRLSRVKIKNFRSIEELELQLEPRCRVLVGINEAGKTNILKALALLSPENDPTPDDVRVPSPEEEPDQESYVWFIFSLERNERLGIYESIKDDMLSPDPEMGIVRDGASTYSLAQLCDAVNECLYIVNVVSGSRDGSYWRFPQSRKILRGWLTPTPACPANFEVTLKDGEEHPLRSFALVHRDSVLAVPDAYLAQATVKDVHALISKALIEYVDDELPECMFWRHSDEYLVPARISLHGFAAQPETCLPLKHAFALADIDNVSSATEQAKNRSNGIRNLLDRVAKRATKHIREVWPEYGGISMDIRQNGDYLETSVYDVHNLYDFSRRSEGFKRFIAFLLMVSAPTKTEALRNVLILNDDPDAGMHPSGARHVRDELIRISANNYVVYSTHSIFMIDRENISRHLIVRKENEITTVEKATDSTIVDEEVLYNALGFSFADILRPHNLIFEGWRDKKLFNVALSRVPSEYADIKKVLVEAGKCHVEGVKDVRRVAPVMELAGRTCTIISDGDKVAREHQSEHRRLKIHGEWLRYDELLPDFGAVTEEDFVKPERISEVVAQRAGDSAMLNGIDKFSSPEGPGVLAALSKWLSRAGLQAEEKKAFVENVKESLFTQLRLKHIRPEYYDMLRNLATKVAASANSR